MVLFAHHPEMLILAGLILVGGGVAVPILVRLGFGAVATMACAMVLGILFAHAVILVWGGVAWLVSSGEQSLAKQPPPEASESPERET
jgi:hypothetical protein